MHPRVPLLVAALGLSLLGCGRAANTPEPIPAATASETQPPAATRTSTPTTRPTLAATLTLRPTQTTIPTRTPGVCPPAPADVPLPAITDPQDFEDTLLGYLTAGGSLESLAAHLDGLNLLGDLGVARGYAQADFDGDGFPEIAISVVEWMEPRSPGAVYVAKCVGGAYRLSYKSEDDEYYLTAQIEAVLDLSGDGLDDLLIRRGGCGASTCYAWIEFVVWVEGRPRNIMPDVFFDLPSTSIDIFGPVMDGSYLIQLTGNGVSSAGAGPYQKRTLTLGQDSNGLFKVLEFRFLPSDYRIHFVHDGDRSFAFGNYGLALDYYNRVIHDSSLLDWPSAGLAPDLAARRPLELAAYARFRRVLARIKMEDVASARVHYADLVESHPPGVPGSGYARMGEIFWSEFENSGDFNAACAAAQEFASANPAAVLEPLEHGYSNPSYKPRGLCPSAP